ncbi:MAG TPA: Ig-like domain-containing protein, partial [Vicinamibacterales bacterium]
HSITARYDGDVNFLASTSGVLPFTVAPPPDTTPPVVTVTGVFDGQFSNAAVTPVFSASDDHLATVTATLDGAPFVSGGVVNADGPHTLVVTAADTAGNRSQSIVLFTLDRTPPVINLSGAIEGEIRSTPATITFTAEDTNLASVTATVDGQPLASGSAVSGEGVHVVSVEVTDRAGNTASAQLTFQIDTTPPALAFASPAEGAHVAATVATLSGTVNDVNAVTVTVAGAPVAVSSCTFLASVALAQGLNSIAVVATDAAGNSTSVIRNVFSNVIPPALTLVAPEAGVVTNAASVEIQGLAIPGDPTDGASVTVTVQGQTALMSADGSFSAVAALADGTNTIVVVATDSYGLQATATRSVIRDATPPAIIIRGVADGQYSNAVALAPAVLADDGNLATVSATIDGAPFVSGTPVSTEGTHSLVVIAADAAGNESDVTVHFTLDRTPPAITVSGVADGDSSNAPSVVPVFSASDTSLASVVATLDGAPFVSGTPVTAEGSHSLVITADDTAGNQSSVTVHFTLVRDDGAMSGRGHVNEANRHHHFVFRVKRSRGTFDGRFEFWTNDARQCRADDDDEGDGGLDGSRDREYGRSHPGDRFEATAVTDVIFSGDPALAASRGRHRDADRVFFAGVGRWNGRAGYTFEVQATDRGEGRGRDTFALVIRDARGTIVASMSGTIDGGNIK